MHCDKCVHTMTGLLCICGMRQAQIEMQRQQDQAGEVGCPDEGCPHYGTPHSHSARPISEWTARTHSEIIADMAKIYDAIPPPGSVQITDPESLANLDQFLAALDAQIKAIGMDRIENLLMLHSATRGFSLTPVWGWYYGWDSQGMFLGWHETDELFRKRLLKSL